MKQTILLLALVGQFSVFAQVIKFVKPVASGNGSGSSWSNASGNLRAVMDAATYGMQIWVAEGEYTPTTCSPCSENERLTSFVLKSGVQVYGGFAGNEDSLWQRNAVLHECILSGDINGDGLPSGNSYNVIFSQHVSAESRIDGFTVRGGQADGTIYSPGERQNSGAGWYNLGNLSAGNSKPVAMNCRFEENYAYSSGGAMFHSGQYNGDVSPAIVQCTFSSNRANKGGAISFATDFDGAALPTFTDCIFEGNMADVNSESNGGALHVSSSEGGSFGGNMSECIFLSNEATHFGGAWFVFCKNGSFNLQVSNADFEANASVDGGAIYGDGSFGGSFVPYFADCKFTENTATLDGAGVYSSGAFDGHASPSFERCRFSSNHSGEAGAATFNTGISGVCQPQFKSCRFLNNQAGTYGGASYCHGKSGQSNASFVNCLFAYNSGYSAGALYNLGSEGGQANPTILNSIFFSNHAIVGGAIYANANDATGQSIPHVSNTIFWDNTASNLGDIFRCIYGHPVVRFCLFDKPDCESLYSGVNGSVSCEEGNIFNVWPEFLDTAALDLHLASSSVAVNAGENQPIESGNILEDLDGLARITAGTVDLGPYEFGQGQFPAIVLGADAGDLDLCAGDTTYFVVDAIGTKPIQYQWLQNGEPIDGATEPSLVIENASVFDSGSYSCLVTNSAGSMASDTFDLWVSPLVEPVISISMSDDTMCFGAEITLVAEASSGLITWFGNGQVIDSGVDTLNLLSNTYESFSATLTSDAACPSNDEVTSNELNPVLIVGTLPDYTLWLSSNFDVVLPGTEVMFVAAIDPPGIETVFQWSLDGVILEGETNDTLYLTASEAGIFYISCEILSLTYPCLEPVSGPSLVISFSVVSTDNINENSSIKLYPNPADDVLILETEPNITYELADMTGRVLKKGITSSQKTVLITTDLPSGVYVLTASSDTNISRQQFIVQR